MKVNRYAAGLLAAGILLTGVGGCAGDAPENSPAPPSASISGEPAQTPEEPTAPPEKTEAPAPSTQEKTFAELAPTTTMEFAELVGDNGIYEIPEKFPEKGTYKVVVDIYHQVVLVYSRDESGEYTVPERYMICTTGSEETPTPLGTFSAEDHRVRFKKFDIDDVYAQYWTQITGEIYFHSLLYTQKDASAYTVKSYKKLGERDSHGCIRLLVPDARWLFYHIAPGTDIEIREGSEEDRETAKIKEQLTRPSLPETRPTLEPGKIPDTDTWTIQELKETLG
ncbi:L,D-transpeptidase family protein [Christensenellaceae bacterium NSJ-63]|uniref:L,D-transpeptidase family protein n=1 Tax=Guopingia tenuis TaxID=2763656 RepID=A0A926DJ04_9FIRM|nr:L,D-transpeptidase [Guopingia tenuis]MBC8538154.1 L,D-transpeptidase family protein [Guopingia tenuis]